MAAGCKSHPQKIAGIFFTQNIELIAYQPLPPVQNWADFHYKSADFWNNSRFLTFFVGPTSPIIVSNLFQAQSAPLQQAG
jgi:hypothetical protein